MNISNEQMKCGLFLLGGIALGALGTYAVTRGCLQGKARPLCTELLSHGIDIKDKVMAKVEAAKEDCADVIAEAVQKAEDRREAREQAEAAQEAVDDRTEAPAAAPAPLPAA